MKELLHGSLLPDGSLDLGNGVIGPSLLDQGHFNSTTDTNKTEPIIQKLSPSSESRKLLRSAGRKALTLLPPSLTIPIIFAACSGGGAAEKNNNQELENKESSGYALPFPEDETWFLTTGPHGDGYSNGIKYAIDIAPPELGRLNGNCPTDGSRLSIDTWVVTASASGEVIIKGDDKNKNDPHHSEIRIKDKNGLTQAYIHLDNTKVKVGNKVNKGDPLGNPSCEYPPGGANTGPHVHVGLMKDGQAIPIDGVVVGGWTIHEGLNGQDGTMTKPGEQTRTANTGRYGENSTGIRNDLTNNGPSKAVVASPKDPISQISGKVKEKSANPVSNVEKPLEKGWSRFTSSNLSYQIDYPSDWDVEEGSLNGLGVLLGDSFEKEVGASPFPGVSIVTKSLPNGFTLNDYKEQEINNIRKFFSDSNLHIDSEIVSVNSQKASKIEFQLPNSDSHHGISYFFIKEGKVWQLGFSAHPLIFDKELPNFQKMLTSFKLLDETIVKPTETPKPAVEKKISLSKKPDDLYRALLTNPISPNMLPPGMSSGGISAGEIDATGKALKQVGAVNILIKDPVFTVAKEFPNGAISYVILPDASTAKNSSEVIGTHFGDGQVLKDFPYPTKIYNNVIGFAGTTTVLVASVENVTVITFLTSYSFTDTDSDLMQSKVISLGYAAIEHLGKVGK